MSLSFKRQLSERIDPSLEGIELCLSVDALMEQNKEWRQEARQVLQGWLLDTHTRGASDLDFGAPGAAEQVWMRVMGNKTPLPTLGEFSSLETAAIIGSWLSPMQKQKLFDNLVLDFSATIPTAREICATAALVIWTEATSARTSAASTTLCSAWNSCACPPPSWKE